MLCQCHLWCWAWLLEVHHPAQIKNTCLDICWILQINFIDLQVAFSNDRAYYRWRCFTKGFAFWHIPSCAKVDGSWRQIQKCIEIFALAPSIASHQSNWEVWIENYCIFYWEIRFMTSQWPDDLWTPNRKWDVHFLWADPTSSFSLSDG